MMLAPQPQLSGRILTLSGGLRGIRQTLDAMRRMVRHYRIDPALRQAATSIVFLTPERDELSEVEALFTWVQQNVRYVRDVLEVETLMTPDKTLASRLGDCDDQSTLLATLLESVGYPTRFVAAGYTDPANVDHVYLQAFVRGDWIDMDPTEPQPMGWAPPHPAAMIIEGVN